MKKDTRWTYVHLQRVAQQYVNDSSYKCLVSNGLLAATSQMLYTALLRWRARNTGSMEGQSRKTRRFGVGSVPATDQRAAQPIVCLDDGPSAENDVIFAPAFLFCERKGVLKEEGGRRIFRARLRLSAPQTASCLFLFWQFLYVTLGLHSIVFYTH